MDAETDFRFGLEAARSGRIDAEKWLLAGLEWLSRNDRSMAEILRQRQWLTDQDVSTIEEGLRRDRGRATDDAPTTRPGDRDGKTVSFHPHASDPNGTKASLNSTVDTDSDPGWDLRIEARPAGEPPHDFGARYTHARFHVDGGIGRVWKVRDAVLGREVAIKELRPDKAHDALSKRRFVEEARITARLVHPNIVPIHDLATWGENPFYAMKFVQGRTLKEAARAYHRGKGDRKIDPAALEFRDLLGAFLAVCNAIGYAHSRGVIHRDIKGQNVILGEFGEVIVLDWGLARRLGHADDPLADRPATSADGSMGGSQPGQAIGTPNYMPPEQAAGDHDRISERSDVFGLGALLYFLLTDHAPFDGRDTTTVVLKAIQSAPPRPRSLNPSIPPALEAICLKAMRKAQDDRYQTADELAAEVRLWLNDDAVKVHPDRAFTKVARWSRKNQPVVAAVAALAITGSLGLGIGSWLVKAEEARTLRSEVERLRARGAEQANFQAATKALREMLGIIVTDLPHVRDRNVDRIRDRAATTIGAFANDLAGRYRDDPNTSLLLAGFLREAAKIRELSYRFADAEALDRRAIDVLAPGGDGTKLAEIPRDLVTEIWISLAESMLSRGDPIAAESAAAEARRIVAFSRTAQPRNPSVSRTEARALLLQAEVANARGQWAEAEPLASRSLSWFDAILGGPEEGPFDAMLAMVAQIDRGIALRGLGRLDDSASTLADAGKRGVALLAKDPGGVDYRNLTALARIELARTLALSGRREAALAQLDDAMIDRLKALVEERPSLLPLSMNLAYARIIRAGIQDDGGAREADQRALEELTAMLATAPASLPCRALRARAALGLAKLALDRGDSNEARRLLDGAAADLKAVLDVNPEDPDAKDARKTLDSLLSRLGPSAPLRSEGP